MLDKIYKLIGSGFYSGYFPFASGTAGSLVAMLFYLIPEFSNPDIVITAIIISFFIGVYLGDYFEKIYGKDPNEFTLDEFVGTWLTFLLVPKTTPFLIGGFIIWRFFDIIKPFPANKMESLKGGWGIMLDDVVSGMYSLLIIYIFKVILY